MKQKYSVSVAIPTYNGGKFLKKQFDRLFSDCNTKKFKNFIEILISDNCSTDQTKNIVSYFKKKNNKNKIFKIKYIKRKINIGFRKNFLLQEKFLNGKYVLFLNDDDLPPKNFYKNLFDLIHGKEINEMIIFPIINSNKYYKPLFGKANKISYIINRGSILSGIVLKKSLINFKLSLKNLYPQTELYLDYYLKFGMRDVDLNSKIKNLDYKKISEKINSDDRMQRGPDFAILGKIEIIEKFYKIKKISFLEYFYSLYSVYKSGLNVKMILHKDHQYKLENNFYLKILNVKKKKFIRFIIFLNFLRKILSKDRGFYFKAFKGSLVN